MSDKPIVLKSWESFHGTLGAEWSPAEDVVRFCARHIRARVGHNSYVERRPVETVLDLGCGSGRYTLFFAEQGFKVSAIDIAQSAVDMTRDWLSARGLTGDVRCASIEEIPFPDASFDALVSFGVLDHVLSPVAQEGLKEIRRVVKPGGLIHLNLRSTKAYHYGEGEQVEPGTFLIPDGPEKGLAQHFWSEEEIESATTGLKILNWELVVRYFDRTLTKCDARWAISAQMP